MKILWIKTELLHPVDKGGKIRTYQMLKALKREHRITYLTLDDGAAAPDARQLAEEYCHDLICVPHQTAAKFSPRFYGDLALNLVTSVPYAVAKYRSDELRRQILAQAETMRPDVVVCDFLAPSINVPAQLPCPAVLFQHNVEAMIWQRHYEVQTNIFKRSYLHSQWQKMDAFERAECRRFDKVIAVSREDAEVMERQYGLDGVDAVPTGVDTEFFRPSGRIETQPNHLVFTGSMDWLPNEDAIRYFTEEILPLVRKIVPDIKLTVVGRNPYPGLVELGRNDPAITVTGRVEDVRPYIEAATAYIIPLRIGGGTRLKVYEALAMEKPLISTTIGVEGLPVCDGGDLLLADTPQHFANAIVRVLQDEGLARHLGAAAAQKVRRNFGWDRVADIFAESCLRIAQPDTGLEPLRKQAALA
jgi:glycosyltransferase involved in cell wall biosynthesis